MVRVDPNRQAEYREAYDAWQKQLSRLHDVFLDGELLEPPQLKGLLNREARAKQRYDAARDALLGIGALPAAPTSGLIGRSPTASIHSGSADGSDEQ
ncbi:MAG: hypothetical protein OXS30_11540 [Chloroflexota bacterium]|nr:hypothetical protein [Chloroflexota bacterium]